MKKNKLWYITKKLLVFVASVLILSILTFYISRLAPGDPLVSYYGERVEKMSPEEREWAEDKLGLNDPISIQYVRCCGSSWHGDFGISYKYKMDVLEVIGRTDWKYADSWRHWFYTDLYTGAAAGGTVCMV